MSNPREKDSSFATNAEWQYALQQSEERFRSLVEQAPVAIGLLQGRNLVMQVCNASLLDIWDKPASIIGMPILEALPEIANTNYFGILQQVFDTGIPFSGRGQRTIVGKRELYLDYSYTPVRDSNQMIIGVMLVAINVTEQVKATRQLEETESSLREALELAELATWSIDPATGAIWYSDRMKQWIGVPEDERGFDEGMNPVPESDRERVRQALEYAMKPESGGKYDLEHPIRNYMTGYIKIIHAQARVYFNESGKPVKMIGTARDVTRERNMQLDLEQQVQQRTEELDASNEELQTTNEELYSTNEELGKLNESLIESNEALQQFAHVASHDLKEPLRKIKTFLGMIEMDERTILSEKSKPFFERVHTSADRMSAMISGVLAYSKVNATEEPIETVDLQEIFNQIMVDLELLVAQKKALIKFEQLPSVEGASVLLYQLFYNLLVNAIKFSKTDQTPVIIILTEKVTVDRTIYAAIRIIDNGIGFDPRQADHIFNTFTRLNSKDKYEGTGLGLSLCKKIVSRHGGTISAEGKPGEGAVFIVMLPIHQIPGKTGSGRMI